MSTAHDLFAAASAAREKAYAPYSGFAVGAAVRASSGRIFAGTNVENASYPVGTCAEAGALAAMVTAGEQSLIEALIVGGDSRLLTPCGACRQRLAEFGGPQTLVHCADPTGIRDTFTLDALLPHAFVLTS